MSETYQKFRLLRTSITDLNNILAVLGWDQEVSMPPEGMAFRAQQVSTLSGIAHEFSTSKEYMDLVQSLEKETLSAEESANIREASRVLKKQQRLSKQFVEKESKAISEAYQAWINAREKDDFSVFKPKLSELVELQKEKAKLYGDFAHPYDALLDDYEPGMTVAKLDVVFTEVKRMLKDFLAKIKIPSSPQNVSRHYDNAAQMELCRQIITDMGYDWKAGRLDFSVHPFTTSFSSQDVRITTRVNENIIEDCIWSGIHEAGHALYEQGLLTDNYGLPAGTATSLAIHESQSRLWENNIGKSMDFLTAYWPDFQAKFPDSFGKMSSSDFFKELNMIKPNLIRINSDEVSYHFHIILRYEIEKGLIEGSYKVEDLPAIWNDKIKEYLGLDVPSDKKGVLQDIHWSHGSFGYFPTYSLGSFYAAQFFEKIKQDLPDTLDQIRKKNFKPILEWLREKIHVHGQLYNAEQLCEMATGEKLNVKYFEEYIKGKWGQNF